MAFKDRSVRAFSILSGWNSNLILTAEVVLKKLRWNWLATSLLNDSNNILY